MVDGRDGQVASLAEDGTETLSGPLEQTSVARDREGHLGLRGRDLEVGEEGEEVGIRRRVAYDLRSRQTEGGWVSDQGDDGHARRSRAHKAAEQMRE